MEIVSERSVDPKKLETLQVARPGENRIFSRHYSEAAFDRVLDLIPSWDSRISLQRWSIRVGSSWGRRRRIGTASRIRPNIANSRARISLSRRFVPYEFVTIESKLSLGVGCSRNGAPLSELRWPSTNIAPNGRNCSSNRS